MEAELVRSRWLSDSQPGAFKGSDAYCANRNIDAVTKDFVRPQPELHADLVQVAERPVDAAELGRAASPGNSAVTDRRQQERNGSYGSRHRRRLQSKYNLGVRCVGFYGTTAHRDRAEERLASTYGHSTAAIVLLTFKTAV